jgi:hypothetical protein
MHNNEKTFFPRKQIKGISKIKLIFRFREKKSKLLIETNQ